MSLQHATDPSISELKADAETFHTVMGLLRDMQMQHGLCQPRSRLACTHCNAKDELDKLLADYKGPRVIPAFS